MNERILELAQQAGITTNLETDFFEKDPNEWVDYFSQKFAELIVRECIDVVDVGGEFVSRPKMVERLKQHFGVEE